MYPLIVPTLYKSFAFVVLVSNLMAIEEITVGFFHGRKVMDSTAELGNGRLNQMIATDIILLLIFIPYFAFRSLGFCSIVLRTSSVNPSMGFSVDYARWSI
jgi:hypothetical protein